MNKADLLLAAVLLAGPPTAPEPTPGCEHWRTLGPALRQVAVEQELMDAGENYLFRDREEFAGDLATVRWRNADLKDAPRAFDACRLPERWESVERIRFNRAFRDRLVARREIELDRADDLSLVIAEADQLYAVWDAIRDARSEYLGVVERRRALKRLRDLIGAEAYDRAEFPPNVPVWRFEGK